ncbi:MAG: MotA/TolQ/ExbB proton channel family protein [Phaeodactylibacter sp.]|nr:MotA/TolQ/ExbB proton channel family protein [Phaeodactylibacter sp.]MCB9050174.1 MotA/TolQ/ExbB proton channel family protein [Lewinellaceae bacterium]
MFNTKSFQLIISILAAAVLWLVLILLSNLFDASTGFHRLIELLGGSGKGYIQAAIYALFTYSLFELYEKQKFIKAQYEGFGLGLLPVRDQLVLSPEEVAKIKLDTIKLEQNGKSLMVADFIKKACTQYRNDQSISETLQVFNAQVETSKSELEGKLETVRYLLGAVISLGFIGTLIGLSSSIGMAHLARTTEGMPEITRNLNVAFDTTLVALLTGLVLNFFYHRYLENMDTFYSRAKSYIIDNLISRIYKAAA